jgi:hypothetical protein
MANSVWPLNNSINKIKKRWNSRMNQHENWLLKTRGIAAGPPYMLMKEPKSDFDGKRKYWIGC